MLIVSVLSRNFKEDPSDTFVIIICICNLKGLEIIKYKGFKLRFVFAFCVKIGGLGVGIDSQSLRKDVSSVVSLSNF